MHYTRWKKHGDPTIRYQGGHPPLDLTERKQCAQCGAKFGPKRGISHAQWGRRQFCGGRCANAWRAQQQRPGLRTQRTWATSWEHRRGLEDGAELKAWGEREDRRRRRIRRATRPLPEPRQWIAGQCPGCRQTVVVIKGWWHGSIYCPSCTKLKWRMSDRQRAKHYGVEHEMVDRFEVFAADGYRCQICGRKTVGKFPKLSSPTIDHIIPLSRGGGHLRHNVQTACFGCNIKKHNGAANDQLRLAVAE
jgi:hypothetical protein